VICWQKLISTKETYLFLYPKPILYPHLNHLKYLILSTYALKRQRFFLWTSLTTIFFKRFVLLYSSSTSNIYYGRYTDLRPKDFFDEKIRDSIFFKASTLDVNYDRYHRKRASSPDPEIFQQESTLWDKDFKSKERVIKNDEDSATQTNRNYRKGLLVLIKLPLPHDYCVHLVPCVFEWLICFEVCCSYAIWQHVATTLKTCLQKNVFVFLAQTKPYQSQRPHTKKATFPEYHEKKIQPEGTERRTSRTSHQEPRSCL
jgi:hypothetical protein